MAAGMRQRWATQAQYAPLHAQYARMYAQYARMYACGCLKLLSSAPHTESLLAPALDVGQPNHP